MRLFPGLGRVRPHLALVPDQSQGSFLCVVMIRGGDGNREEPDGSAGNRPVPLIALTWLNRAIMEYFLNRDVCLKSQKTLLRF